MITTIGIAGLSLGLLWQCHQWLSTPACGPDCESGNHVTRNMRLLSIAVHAICIVILAVTA